jgi:hypothetical protein
VICVAVPAVTAFDDGDGQGLERAVGDEDRR